jgi:hypothetical protein
MAIIPPFDWPKVTDGDTYLIEKGIDYTYEDVFLTLLRSQAAAEGKDVRVKRVKEGFIVQAVSTTATTPTQAT